MVDLMLQDIAYRLTDIAMDYLSEFGISIVAPLSHPGGRAMGHLPDTQNCGLRMGRECRERFPRHRLQRNPLISDPGMYHGTWVKHVSWCMPGSLTRGSGEKRSRHSRRMRNLQFYVSDKGPMGASFESFNLDYCVVYCVHCGVNWPPRARFTNMV